MKNKKILILGATGGIGQWAVKIAKERGYEITVVVRSKAKFKNAEGIKVIQGNVLDSEVLENAMKGQDAVVSCLGIMRKNGKNPWSALASPTDFTESVAMKTVAIMEKQGIQRLVTVSAAGVGDSWNKLSWFMKFMIGSSNVKLTFADFDNMEKILHSSNIDSLSVRPVGLVDEQPTDKAKIVDRFITSSKISKSDVAKWMIDALEREERFKNPTEMIGWS